MFYVSAEIDQGLKCSYCKEQFSDMAKLIPDCGESICGKCYEEIRSQLDETADFECRACQEMHVMPHSGFVENRALLKILGRAKVQWHLNDKATSLKASIDELMSEFNSLSSFNSRQYVNQLCDQLSVDVRKSIEVAAKRLEATERESLRTIDEYRCQCLATVSDQTIREDLETFGRSVTDFIQHWHQRLNRGEAIESEINSATTELQSFHTQMQSFESQLKRAAVNGQTMTLQTRQPFEDLISLSTQYHQEALKQLDVQPKILRTLEGHELQVAQALFLSEGRLASCSYDKSIRIWNSNDGSEICKLEGHTSCVYAIVLLSNGDLASASADMTIKIWNLTLKQEVKTLRGHTSAVTSLVVLKDGRLASLANDDTMRIWNPFSSESNLLLTMTGHRNVIWPSTLGVLSDDRLVTFLQDTKDSVECVLSVWNSGEGKLEKQFSTGLKSCYSMCVLSNDQVALGFVNGTILVADLNDQSLTKKREGAYASCVLSLAQSSNRCLVSAGWSNDSRLIKFWNLDDLALLRTVPFDKMIYNMAISSDEGILAVATNEKTITLLALACE